MVAQLIKLRWRLFVNGLIRNKWQLFGVILGGLYMGFLLVIGALALAAMTPEDAPFAQMIVVTLSALVVLGWTVVPAFFTGMDGAMEPQRFALFPISAGRLAPGLLLAGFIGVPGVATLIFMLIAAFSFKFNADLLAWAIVAGLLSALAAQLFGRTFMTWFSTVGVKRGVRELGTVVLFLPVMFMGPMMATLGPETDHHLIVNVLNTLATVSSYSPFGAFFGAVWAFASGNMVHGVISSVIGFVSLVVCWVLYVRIVKKAAVSPPHTAASKDVKGLGWIGRMPATPWGAIAGRALIYWLKDARYSASLIMVPVLIVVIGIFMPLFQPDAAFGGHLAGIMVGALMGFSISADISYDSTAFHTHVLTGVRGWQDRLGRVVAVLPLSFVAVGLSAVVPLLILDRVEMIPDSLLASLAALGVSLGLSALVSARWIYAVPQPGDSPFQTPQGAGMRMFITQTLYLVAVAILLAPTMVFYLMAWNEARVVPFAVTAAFDIVWGLVICVVGIWLGGKWYDRSTPELMQTVIRHA
ncbi:hypothetical protein HMPREF3160_03130 [Arthrobacter sp. HMSC06H05]|uniref:hypothetical protein n=1 Tax=Arthrobacter sp. HMSC06H05 TaxID=1581128 RepID=UPI0008A4FB21|nr:hypothetical protein [Arthrobacter sp. HMSC06H05]OFT43149.1 hypothetical protein HMPREF3160_03130 [Arthrobacter sp. HMSC06H05]